MRKSNMVYLSGCIAGSTFDEASSWRDRACEMLAMHNIECLTPMRGKDGVFGDKPITLEGYNQYDGIPLASKKGLTRRDRHDTMNCGCLLVYLKRGYPGDERVSIGTMIEVGWADACHNIPIVLVVDEDSKYDHPMLNEIAWYTVNSLEEACELIPHVIDNV